MKYGDRVRTSGGVGLLVARVEPAGVLVAHARGEVPEALRGGFSGPCWSRVYERHCEVHDVWFEQEAGCPECKATAEGG